MSEQLSRRTLLKVMGVSTLGGALAACLPIQAPSTSPPPAAASPDQEAQFKRIEELLGKLYDIGSFAGAVLFARDGEILFSQAWGLADRENNIPNTPQTIFRIGEMTLQFTAASALLLEQEEKLDLQEPISSYLADCPPAWQGISLHHLLSHMSGIPDYTDTAAANKFMKEGATPEQLLALFRDLPLIFTPGESREFSHSGFVVAGLIIEQISGQSYGDFVKEHLFDPLQMKDSGYGDPPEGLALGYQSSFSKEPVLYDVSSLYASGGCYSTAEDLYRWNEGLYNGMVLNDSQLQKMLTSHATFGEDLRSGYGIVLGEHNKRQLAGNAGSPQGYSSAIKRFLDERVTSLMIGNQDMDAFILLEPIEDMFFDML